MSENSELTRAAVALADMAELAGDLLKELEKLADYYERFRAAHKEGPSEAITRARNAAAKARKALGRTEPEPPL
jgi:hypothetical protein